MATLTVRRAAPFTRGDGIIQVFIDGKIAGNLFGNKQVLMDVPAGEHVLQARMYGMRGKRQAIHLNDGDAQTILVHGVKELQAFKWEAILFIIACSLPDDVLPGYASLIKWLIYAVVLAFALYRLRINTRAFLRMEVVPQREMMQTA